MLNSIQPPKVATINEVAKIFHLPRHFVRQLVLLKKIKFLKVGKKYLVNIESLSNFLDECSDETVNENGTQTGKDNINE